MAGALQPELTDFAAIEKKIERAFRDGLRIGDPLDATAAVAVQRVLTGASPETRLFTADEVVLLVTAVASAEREVSGATIMAHVQGAKTLDKQSAEAVRKIVVAAYVHLLVGEV